jgi:hypothetical protein
LKFSRRALDKQLVLVTDIETVQGFPMDLGFRGMLLSGLDFRNKVMFPGRDLVQRIGSVFYIG